MNFTGDNSNYNGLILGGTLMRPEFLTNTRRVFLTYGKT